MGRLQKLLPSVLSSLASFFLVCCPAHEGFLMFVIKPIKILTGVLTSLSGFFTYTFLSRELAVMLLTYGNCILFLFQYVLR